VLPPQTDTDGAAVAAERIRQAVEALRIPRVDRRGELRVTASLGVTSLAESAEDEESLIASADEALYRARGVGKHRVERAHPAAASR